MRKYGPKALTQLIGRYYRKTRYHVNGVTYIVESKFATNPTDMTAEERFCRIFENDTAVHLTDFSEDDTMRSEYVLDSAEKEDYADQNQ